MLLLEKSAPRCCHGQDISLHPEALVPVVLSSCQVPGTSQGHTLEQRFEPRDQALHTSWSIHGCFEGGSRWIQKAGPQEAEPALSPLPSPCHQSSENLQSSKPIRLSVAFWGTASCLVMKFHSLIVSLGGRRSRGRAYFTSTKTQNSTQDPDHHQPSFLTGCSSHGHHGARGAMPISQANLLRQSRDQAPTPRHSSVWS